MNTHVNDPSLRSWVEVKEGSPFPIQNLPFGIFKPKNSFPRVGVAIGDKVLDLWKLGSLGFFAELALEVKVFENDFLNDFIALGKAVTSQVRATVSELLREGNSALDRHRDYVLFNQSDVELLMPIRVGDYTDFYSSKEHATNVGCMFRDPANALFPNWKHLPVGYHGRASSIVVSGTPIHRPKGQTLPANATEPVFGESKLLDFELEMAFIIGKENGLGNSVSTAAAEDYIFGFVLFNDWSARDIQKWEYVPLGPFLAKNFASTVSPWVVTLDALDPFRVESPEQDPQVLPYLQYEGKHNFDIALEVSILPKGSDQETVISRSNFKYLYWNVCQQLAHHTINGCNMRVGDMLASGTISGPTADSYGSMLELTWSGQNPITLADGSQRKFIQDHDTVIIRGYCDNGLLKIGFGEVRGEILPAKG